jgi:hypothetical protein
MSAYEFGLHWDSYCRSPWGTERDALHTAHIVQTIGNYAGKSRNDPLKLADCKLRFVDPTEPVVDEVDPSIFFGNHQK